LLVDCLLKRSESVVAVVDTTGNFDVVGLYTRILVGLERSPEKASELGGAVGDEGREGVAAKVLDRVKIMRVFDLVGVREAVAELRDGLEGRTSNEEEDDGKEQEVVEPATRQEEKAKAPKRTVVADSEDEEMLFDTEIPSPAATPPEASRPNQQSTSRDEQPQPPVKLILIDNLAHVLTPLLKKDSIQGPSPSSLFSLHTL
jgi:hypothetical protein